MMPGKGNEAKACKDLPKMSLNAFKGKPRKGKAGRRRRREKRRD